MSFVIVSMSPPPLTASSSSLVSSRSNVALLFDLSRNAILDEDEQSKRTQSEEQHC
jgi:hypothetical protein